MAVSLIPPGPDAPPAVRGALKSFYDALRSLLNPGAPTPVFAVAQADLPPAANYQNCIVLVSDLNILAHSDGTDWIRQDTGAAI